MSDEKPLLPQEKSASATGGRKPSLADLIAQTPGAQPREQLLERIKARQQKRSNKQQKPAPSEEELSRREPTPLIDRPDDFASDFFERLKKNAKAKQNGKPKAQPKQPQGSMLRLVRKDGKPVPPDKQ